MNLLHISASPMGEHSTSITIANTFVRSYQQAHPGAKVDHWDLWDGSLPEFDSQAVQARLAGFAGQTPTGAQATAWTAVLDTFARYDAYDRVLFSIPMWNSGIPYKLKQFIDVISQLGLVFRINPQSGYEHLLADRGKKVAVIYTSAVWGPDVTPNFGHNFQSTYFDDWLRWTGIEDISVIEHRPTLSGDAASVLTTSMNQARSMAASY